MTIIIKFFFSSLFLLQHRKSNPTVRKYVTEKYGSDYRKLESEFVEKLLEIIKSYPGGNGYIGKYLRDNFK